MFGEFSCVGCDDAGDVLVSGEVSEVIEAQVCEKPNGDRSGTFGVEGEVHLHLVELHPFPIAGDDANDFFAYTSTGGNLENLGLGYTGVIEDAGGYKFVSVAN